MAVRVRLIFILCVTAFLSITACATTNLTSVEDGQYNLIKSFIKAIINNLSKEDLL
jgi:hypothetical protein